MIRKNKCNGRKQRIKGMTLIELMVVVAILGIISAFAYPSYTEHVVKAHRMTALADLTKIQLEVESRYNYNDGNYISAATGIISGGSCGFCEIDTSKYTLSISTPTTTSYEIIATAVNGSTQASDTCLSGLTNKQIILKFDGTQEPSECWE